MDYGVIGLAGQSLRRLTIVGAAAVLVALSVHSTAARPADWRRDLEVRLEATFPLSKQAAGQKRSGGLSEIGTVMVVRQGGLLGSAPFEFPTRNVIRDGKRTTSAGSTKSTQRFFVPGDPVYVLDIVVGSDFIMFHVLTRELYDILYGGTKQQVRFGGSFYFEFPKGRLVATEFSAVLKTINAVLVGETDAGPPKTSTVTPDQPRPNVADVSCGPRVVIETTNTATENTAAKLSDWKRALEARLQTVYGPRAGTAGAVVIVCKSGIVGSASLPISAKVNTILDGKILISPSVVAPADRQFAIREPVDLLRIDIADAATTIWIRGRPVRGQTVSEAERHDSAVVFKFTKQPESAAELNEVVKGITNVLVPEADYEAPTRPAAPAVQTAPAGAASPPVTPKTIKLGQTRQEVESIFGPPGKIIDLGEKVTYIYSDIRVIFVNGRVSEVQ